MVVKYQPGQEFKTHVDYFDPQEDEKAIENGGQRIATFFVWLNDLKEDDGGSTTFPRLGLKCIPDQGSALFWWNQYGRTLLSDTEHQGSPLKKGTKYGLNIWIRYPGW
jgi:prolyl 4-hydroxylase